MSNSSSKQQDIEKKLTSVSKALQRALNDLERVQTLLQHDLANTNGAPKKQREVHRLLQTIGENLSETAIGFGMIAELAAESNQPGQAD